MIYSANIKICVYNFCREARRWPCCWFSILSIRFLPVSNWQYSEFGGLPSLTSSSNKIVPDRRQPWNVFYTRCKCPPLVINQLPTKYINPLFFHHRTHFLHFHIIHQWCHKVQCDMGQIWMSTADTCILDTHSKNLVLMVLFSRGACHPMVLGCLRLYQQLLRCMGYNNNTMGPIYQQSLQQSPPVMFQTWNRAISICFSKGTSG